jgi:hypothetical protein
MIERENFRLTGQFPLLVVLIDQTRIYIEQYSKTAKKRWSLCEYDEEDESITLTSIPFQISLADVYNKVKFGETQKN